MNKLLFLFLLFPIFAFTQSNLYPKSNAEESCQNKYNINQIITSKDDAVNEKLFSCK